MRTVTLLIMDEESSKVYTDQFRYEKYGSKYLKFLHTHLPNLIREDWCGEVFSYTVDVLCYKWQSILARTRQIFI